MHSGVEKEVDGSTGSIQVPWNDGEHRRRLIHHIGACVDGEDKFFVENNHIITEKKTQEIRREFVAFLSENFVEDAVIRQIVNTNKFSE